jgi:hypothetical protein
VADRMKDTTVAKASPIGDIQIDDVVIRIVGKVPDFAHSTALPWEGEVAAFYDAQAGKIVEALLSLPGGTLDRVLAKLISRSVSLHRIPWETPKR